MSNTDQVKLFRHLDNYRCRTELPILIVWEVITDYRYQLRNSRTISY